MDARARSPGPRAPTAADPRNGRGRGRATGVRDAARAGRSTGLRCASRRCRCGHRRCANPRRARECASRHRVAGWPASVAARAGRAPGRRVPPAARTGRRRGCAGCARAATRRPVAPSGQVADPADAAPPGPTAPTVACRAAGSRPHRHATAGPAHRRPAAAGTARHVRAAAASRPARRPATPRPRAVQGRAAGVAAAAMASRGAWSRLACASCGWVVAVRGTAGCASAREAGPHPWPPRGFTPATPAAAHRRRPRHRTRAGPPGARRCRHSGSGCRTRGPARTPRRPWRCRRAWSPPGRLPAPFR